jgi:hypothetical protein
MSAPDVALRVFRGGVPFWLLLEAKQTWRGRRKADLDQTLLGNP